MRSIKYISALIPIGFSQINRKWNVLELKFVISANINLYIYCGHFEPKKKSLRPSEAEILFSMFRDFAREKIVRYRGVPPRLAKLTFRVT